MQVRGVYLWKDDKCVDLFTDYGDVRVSIDFEGKSVIVREAKSELGCPGKILEWHNLAMYDHAVITEWD